MIKACVRESRLYVRAIMRSAVQLRRHVECWPAGTTMIHTLSQNSSLNTVTCVKLLAIVSLVRKLEVPACPLSARR